MTAASPPIARVLTEDPVGATLRAMGRAAQQAGETWTVREWAARLATKAKPHDYVGQLRELYDDILRRWRYVREPGEWVTSTGDAVVRYTLGAKYNCEDPLRCVVSDARAREWQRGWGDCDDVTALVSAGALALGMTPHFRAVFPAHGNGGHVSALVTTPDGKTVSVDPVGHPKQRFGWAYAPPGARILVTDLQGRTVASSTAPAGRPMLGYMPPNCVSFGPNPYARTMAGTLQITHTAGLCGMDIDAPGAQRMHMPDGMCIILRPGAPAGGRALAMPNAHARIFRRGMVLDGALAWDQFGDMYEFVHDVDAFVPAGFYREGDIGIGLGAGLGSLAGSDCVPLTGDLSGIRSRRRRRRARIKARRQARRSRARKRRIRRRKRVARAVRKVTRPIGRAIRKIASKALGSKLVQAAAAAGLKVFGVPPQVTKGIMSAVSRGAGGAIGKKFVQLVMRRKYREAARLVRDFAKREGGQLSRQIEQAAAQMGAMESGYVAQYGTGHAYHAAPVVALAGVHLGEADAVPPEPDEEDDGDVVLPPEAADDEPMADVAPIADTPTPGAWYRIGVDPKMKGKGFLTHVGTAYGVGSGSQRLALSKMVAAHPANRNVLVPAKGNAAKWYPGGVPSFLPKYASDINAAWAGQPGKSFAVVYFPVDADDPGPSGPPNPPQPKPMPPEPPAPPIPPAPPEPTPPPPEPEPAPPGPGPKPTNCPPGTAPFLSPPPPVGSGTWVCRPIAKPEPPPPAPAPPAPPKPIKPSGPPDCGEGFVAMLRPASQGGGWMCVEKPKPKPPAPAPAPPPEPTPPAPAPPAPAPPAPAPAPAPWTPPAPSPGMFEGDDLWLILAVIGLQVL